MLPSCAFHTKQQHSLKRLAMYLGDTSGRVRTSRDPYSSCFTALQTRQMDTRRSHKAITFERKSSSSTQSLRNGCERGVSAALSNRRSTRGQDRSSRRPNDWIGRALGVLVATSFHEFPSLMLLFLRLASDGVLDLLDIPILCIGIVRGVSVFPDVVVGVYVRFVSEHSSTGCCMLHTAGWAGALCW